MSVKEDIEDIRNRLDNDQYTTEASVSTGIVLRLLIALGWPVHNPTAVKPEYTVEGRRVDFALFAPESRLRVFIEVKPVEQIQAGEEQLFEYATHCGVPIAILTDGQEWRFYHPGGEGSYEERRVCTLEFS